MIIFLGAIIIRDIFMLILKTIMNITSYIMFKRYHNKRVAVGQNTDRNKVIKDKAL